MNVDSDSITSGSDYFLQIPAINFFIHFGYINFREVRRPSHEYIFAIQDKGRLILRSSDFNLPNPKSR